jgi:protein-disulfide isomerase
VEFVRNKARLQGDAALELAYSEPVGESCYQAVHFRVKGPGGARGGADMVVFLSPDQKFISRDLTDWRLDSVLNPGRGLPQEPRVQKLTNEEFRELTRGDLPSKGKADAPIQIALFTDFQCPYCKQQAMVFKEGFKEGEVRIVFHHLPLSSHPWAQSAAELTGCVVRQDNSAFWAVFDALYENQAAVDRASLPGFVRKQVQAQRGFDLKGFDTCVAENRANARVEEDKALSKKYGLRATPAMFINGTLRQGVTNADEIRRIAGNLGRGH